MPERLALAEALRALLRIRVRRPHGDGGSRVGLRRRNARPLRLLITALTVVKIQGPLSGEVVFRIATLILCTRLLIQDTLEGL